MDQRLGSGGILRVESSGNLEGEGGSVARHVLGRVGMGWDGGAGWAGTGLGPGWDRGFDLVGTELGWNCLGLGPVGAVLGPSWGRSGAGLAQVGTGLDGLELWVVTWLGKG